jgi:hypothetical protein
MPNVSYHNTKFNNGHNGSRQSKSDRFSSRTPMSTDKSIRTNGFNIAQLIVGISIILFFSFYVSGDRASLEVRQGISLQRQEIWENLRLPTPSSVKEYLQTNWPPINAIIELVEQRSASMICKAVLARAQNRKLCSLSAYHQSKVRARDGYSFPKHQKFFPSKNDLATLLPWTI